MTSTPCLPWQHLNPGGEADKDSSRMSPGRFVNVRSGWGFTVKQDGRTVHEDSGAHRVMTSSLTMEVEAFTHAIQWLAYKRDAQITHAIILQTQ